MWNGINNRKFPRANYPCKISLRKKGDKDTYPSTTENIGVGGICTILSNDLGIFAPVEIELDLLDDKPIISCEGSVAWIIKRKGEEPTKFDTGVEFANLKEEDISRISKVVEKILRKLN